AWNIFETSRYIECVKRTVRGKTNNKTNDAGTLNSVCQILLALIGSESKKVIKKKITNLHSGGNNYKCNKCQKKPELLSWNLAHNLKITQADQKIKKKRNFDAALIPAELTNNLSY
ncbi:hypothetical protein Tcan_07993, partial [Toxocara canis]